MKMRMIAVLGALAIAAPLTTSTPSAEAGIFGRIKKGLKKFGKKVKRTVKGVASKVKRGARKIVGKARRAFNRGKQRAKKFISGVKKRVRTGWARVKRGTKRLVGKVKRGAKRIFGKVKRGTKRFFGRVKRGVKRLAGKVKRGATRVLDRIKGQVKNIWTQIKRSAGKALQRLKALGKDLLSKVKKMGQAAAARALTPVFHAYIEANRRYYQRRAKPLTASEKSYLAAFYPQRLINGMRVLELSGSTGFFNKSAGATTYAKNFVIFRKGHRTNSTMKHEFVHACQYEKHGQRGFAGKYAEQYVKGGFKYENIEFEKQAYDFQRNHSGPVSKYLGYCN